MNITSLFLATLLSTTNVCNDNIENLENNESLVEIVSERTDNTKVFKMDNGNHKVRIYDRNIHYEKENEYYEFDYNFYENNVKYYSSKGKYGSNIGKDNNKVVISYNQTNEFELLLDNSLFSGDELTKSDNLINNGKVAFYEDESAFYFSSVINNTYEMENSKYSIKNTSLEANGISFYNNNDEEIYNVTNTYLVSSNNILIHPTSVDVTSVGNDTYEVSPNYDLTILNNAEIEYPLISVSSVAYSQNNTNGSFNDKYVINQTSYTYDESMLLVGKDNIKTINPSGMLINTEYVGILEVERPRIRNTLVPNEDILSVDLVLNRNSSSSITCPVIDLYKITNSSLTFSSIDGTSNLSKTFLSTKQAGLSTYTFDITNALKSSNNSLLLALNGSTSGTRAYASFYSSNSASNASYIEIEYRIHNGNATSIPTPVEIDGPCFNYVFNINADPAQLVTLNFIDGYITQNSSDLSSLSQAKQYLCATLHFYNIQYYRIIESYDSYILPTERRVAFRHAVPVNGVDLKFHFIKQHANGHWTGSNNSDGGKIYEGTNPDNSLLFTGYASETVYIAYYWKGEC